MLNCNIQISFSKTCLISLSWWSTWIFPFPSHSKLIFTIHLQESDRLELGKIARDYERITFLKQQSSSSILTFLQQKNYQNTLKDLLLEIKNNFGTPITLFGVSESFGNHNYYKQIIYALVICTICLWGPCVCFSSLPCGNSCCTWEIILSAASVISFHGKVKLILFSAHLR